MAPADSHRVSRVPCYSGVRSDFSGFHIQGCHLLWRIFPDASIIPTRSLYQILQPRRSEDRRFGLFPFRSPLLRESNFFLLSGYLDVSVRRLLLSYLICKQLGYEMTGYDSSRVSPFGNLRIKGCRTYPKLIAADHVLHRLPAPRHPPCALSILNVSPQLCRLVRGTHPLVEMN